jgi:hypothetical protein
MSTYVLSRPYLRYLMDPEYLIWDHTTATTEQQAAIRDSIALWRGGGRGVADATAGAGFPGWPPGFQYDISAPNLPRSAPVGPAFPPDLFAPIPAASVPVCANGVGNVYELPNVDDAHQFLCHVSATVHGVSWLRISAGMPATRYLF